MKKNQLVFKLLIALCVLGLLAVACAPANTPAPAATQAPAKTQAPAATEAPAATATAAPVTLTYLVDDSQITQDWTHALAKAYMKLHPNVTIQVENRPQGSDGDNVVKTRLATGEMDDLFFYNAGSLLQALHPADTLVDLTNQPFMDNVVDSFKPAVTQDGKVYGVPTGTAMAGGIIYNKKVFDQVGISVPKTWAEFEANNEKLKAAGIAPVIATFGDSWTSQLFVLGDYCNVQNQMPNFAQDYTANKIKFASTPIAMEGFSYLQEGYKNGWWQKDYATTKYEQGLKILADGGGAQFPMLTFALPTIATNSPDEVNDIGFFGIPPSTDGATPCATIWMPAGTYIPKTSKHIAEAEDFLAFIASPAGADALTAVAAPSGPYMIKGAKLPDTVLPAVNDIQAYIDSGNSAPALEFISPVKGPSLPDIGVAVGTGQMSADQAAAAYDTDVAKQAQQLGLPGW